MYTSALGFLPPSQTLAPARSLARESSAFVSPYDATKGQFAVAADSYVHAMERLRNLSQQAAQQECQHTLSERGLDSHTTRSVMRLVADAQRTRQDKPLAAAATVLVNALQTALAGCVAPQFVDDAAALTDEIDAAKRSMSWQTPELF